jgi:hypothetical protein
MLLPLMNIECDLDRTSGIDALRRNINLGQSPARCPARSLIARRRYVILNDNTPMVVRMPPTSKKCGLLVLTVVRWSSISVDSTHLKRPIDVGGGAVRNEIRNNLARIPLRWMIRQCFVTKTGILFHREMFPVFGMDPESLWPVVKPRPPPVKSLSATPNHEHKYIPSVGTSRTLVDVSDFISEEEEDLADAFSPINDMLNIAKSWWILEVLPQNIRFQNDQDSWVRKLSYVVYYCFYSPF